MKTTVDRWGKSLVIRLPAAIAKKAGLAEGVAVEVRVSSTGEIVLSSPGPRYALRDLVAAINRKNRHDEVDLGPPLGKEVW